MPFRLNPVERRRGESPVLMAPNVIEPGQCARLIEIASALPPIEARTGEGDIDPTLRASTIRWVPQEPVFASLYDAIGTALFNLNQHFFGYDLTTIEDLQFTTYVEASRGFYDWHPDATLNPRDDSARKLSMTVQLSDPADYDGGELELWYDRQPTFAKKELGLGVLFPAPTLHRVTPVTRGRRHSLVAWASGPRFR